MLVLLIIALSFVNLYLLFQNMSNKYDSVNNQIKILIKELDKYPKIIRGIDGISPLKGIDYFDGTKGKDGKSGVDGKNGTNGASGNNGIDGLIPELQCNTVKNRWEVRYVGDENYQVLNGTPIKCTVTDDDIRRVIQELVV